MSEYKVYITMAVFIALTAAKLLFPEYPGAIYSTVSSETEYREFVQTIGECVAEIKNPEELAAVFMKKRSESKETEEIAKVYQTSDYSVFKRIAGNRPVDTRRKNRLRQSIQEFGYILNPIVVNENMEVIDGQGRLAALKELSLPVPYIIAEGAGSKECMAMNINMSNWRVKDYVNSYAELGNENYIRFKKFMEDHNDLTVDEAFGIITNRIITNGYGSIAIKEGDLIFTEEQLIKVNRAAQFIDGIKKEIEYIPGSRRVKRSAIAWVVQNTPVDINRLKKQIMERYTLIQPATDSRPDLFLQSLSDIYNYHLSAQNCIDFEVEYKRALRSRE